MAGQLRVCYFGTYRANYSRNQIMIAALRAAGVEVIECHVPLWSGVEDRVRVASGHWASGAFLKRLISAYSRLLAKYLALAKNDDYDIMVVGYPGQMDLFLARLLTWLRGRPLVLDMFMSIYLVALERGLGAKSALSLRLLRGLEALACRLPERLICDTEAYRAWYHQTHRLSPERFRLVPTGADDRFFKPLAAQPPNDGRLRVLYYGSYIPNHGLETIVEAAHLLRDYPDIQFELIGAGPTKATAQRLAQTYALTNLDFTDWVEKEALPARIAQADLLLGVFGTTPQSIMTVQNKIYEGLAMAKPIITGHSPTVQAQLGHGQAVFLVERNNPPALAAAILTLRQDPTLRASLASHGQALFQANYTINHLGDQFRHHLEELSGSR